MEFQESESEEELLDLVDEVEDEEHEHEVEAPVHPEPVVKKAPEPSAPAKETERQLSKKERKKKELEELEALLADFGVAQKDSNGQGNSLPVCDLPRYSSHKLVSFLCVPPPKKEGKEKGRRKCYFLLTNLFSAEFTSRMRLLDSKLLLS